MIALFKIVISGVCFYQKGYILSLKYIFACVNLITVLLSIFLHNKSCAEEISSPPGVYSTISQSLFKSIVSNNWELKSKFIINRYQSLFLKPRYVEDTIQSKLLEEGNLKKRGIFWVRSTIMLGHHDNFTKAKSSNDPKLKESGFYLNWPTEGGLQYKIFYPSLYFGFMIPIPVETNEGGYEHKNYFIFIGPSMRIRPLSRRFRINLEALGGYKWLNERAQILDRTRTRPDLLDKYYVDSGPFIGGEVSYIIYRDEEVDAPLILGYVHESLRVGVNKYRVELATGSREKFVKSESTGEVEKAELVFLRLGIEITDWTDGRRDWFFIITFGVEGI